MPIEPMKKDEAGDVVEAILVQPGDALAAGRPVVEIE